MGCAALTIPIEPMAGCSAVLEVLAVSRVLWLAASGGSSQAASPRQRKRSRADGRIRTLAGKENFIVKDKEGVLRSSL